MRTIGARTARQLHGARLSIRSVSTKGGLAVDSNRPQHPGGSMKIQMVSAYRVAATGTLALLLTGAASAQTHRTEKHFAVQGNPIVTVQNASGHIQVKAWDKHEVMIVGQSASNSTE